MSGKRKLSDEAMKDHAYEFKRTHGKITVDLFLADLQRNGYAADRTRVNRIVGEVNDSEANLETTLRESIGDVSADDAYSAIRKSLPDAVRASIEHLARSVYATLQQRESKVYQEAETRLGVARRTHEAELAGVHAEKAVLQSERDDLRDALAQAEQSATEAQRRAASTDQALAALRAHVEQREAAYHDERLRLIEQFDEAQRSKDEAVKAQHAAEQAVQLVQQQVDWVRQETTRERERADGLEQKLEQARAAAAAAERQIAALGARLETIEQLRRDPEHTPRGTRRGEQDGTEEADHDAAA